MQTAGASELLAFIICVATSCCQSSAQQAPQRQFALWKGDQCPSDNQRLLPARQQLVAVGRNPASRCTLLCHLTASCHAACVRRGKAPGDSSVEDDCRMFGWGMFIGGNFSVQTVKCEAEYKGGCFVATTGPVPELIPLRNCSQSSVEYGGYCEYGMDGNFTQNHYQHPCTHTAFEPNRWWRVSFARRAVVTSVTIFNRIDSSPERLDNFSISVDGQTCADFALNGTAAFYVRSFACHRAGSSLEISSPQIGILSLCEVQAWGYQVD